MRGRKPTPTVLRIVRGNPGRRRLNTNEPKPDALDTRCPDELVDEVARKEWARGIVPAIKSGEITEVEQSMAIAHCVELAIWQSQLEEARKHPHIIRAGKNEYPMPNPAQVAANKTLLLLMKIDAELGLTPSSRSRVSVSGGVRKTSQLEQFRNAKASSPW